MSKKITMNDRLQAMAIIITTKEHPDVDYLISASDGEAAAKSAFVFRRSGKRNRVFGKRQ